MKLVNLKAALILLSFTTYSASYAEYFSAVLKQQSAYNIQDTTAQESPWQQNEWQFDLEYNNSIDSGPVAGDLVAIMRARYDFQDQLEGKTGNTLRMRELYWQRYGDNSFWQIGKQQVVWGEADGIKLLDVINPQSFREFILDDVDDSRIPLWMLNAQLNTSDSGMLQLLIIPDTSTHELTESDSTYQLTSPVIVPTIDADSLDKLGVSKVKIKEKSHATGGDFGIRYSDFVDVLDSAWDISLNYLYHYVDTPVIRNHIDNEMLIVDYQFEPSHLIGGSASTVISDFILRTEVAYETDRYQRAEETIEELKITVPNVLKGDSFSSVLGIDYQGLTDNFISIQWYRQTLLLNKTDLQQAIANRDEDRLTLLWETKFLNETLTTRWQHIHGLNHNDGILRPKVIYNWQSNIDVYLGADYFYGNSEDFFGQFNKTDRIVAGFTIGI